MVLLTYTYTLHLQVGTVLSFKLVYDRDNGKPRGYGFCEYQGGVAMSFVNLLNREQIFGVVKCSGDFVQNRCNSRPGFSDLVIRGGSKKSALK